MEVVSALRAACFSCSCALRACRRPVLLRKSAHNDPSTGTAFRSAFYASLAAACPAPSHPHGSVQNSHSLGRNHLGAGSTALRRGIDRIVAMPTSERRFWTPAPIRMGRRSAKIATRKTAQDQLKSKVYGKIGKMIIRAVKDGGADPKANLSLATVLRQAQQAGVPKDIIDRNIKKALDKNQADFSEITYEVYGAGGAGIVTECLTDNLNRTASLVRDVVKKGGGKMADPGSVMFNFATKGVVAVPAVDVDSDELMMAAVDAGAEDVLEPGVSSEEERDDEPDAKVYRILTAPDQFYTIRTALEASKVPIVEDRSGLQLIPTATIEVDDAARQINETLLAKLLEVDDVDAVHSNMA